MNAITECSLAELAGKLQRRELSPVEVVEQCLARIEATEPTLHAYVAVFADDARAAARQAEAEIAGGKWQGPLHGVPVAIKDLFDLAGTATTASSRVRVGWMRTADSAIVSKLRDAGAIIVGKAHTHEFAYGVTTPATRNPWDPSRVPGGSSGGPAPRLHRAGSTRPSERTRVARFELRQHCAGSSA